MVALVHGGREVEAGGGRLGDEDSVAGGPRDAVGNAGDARRPRQGDGHFEQGPVDATVRRREHDALPPLLPPRRRIFAPPRGITSRMLPSGTVQVSASRASVLYSPSAILTSVHSAGNAHAMAVQVSAG